MTDPFTGALIGAGISAVGSIGGSFLSRRPKESKTQRQKRELIDDLIASLRGGGSFGDLFEMDETAFQKSFVDPAKARFANQTAPQIQQQFIASGQQRGTGLDDTLTRAGVDMDQLLNEKFFEFQQGAQNRKLNAFSSILGAPEGVKPDLSIGESFRGGVSGFAQSKSFEKSLDRILDAASGRSGGNRRQNSSREGFA